MQWKRIGRGDPATYVVVLEPGDEAIKALTDFAITHELSAAQITAIGAFERATVAWFDRRTTSSHPIYVDEQCEVLSLIGDVAMGAEGPLLHLHAVLGLNDGHTRGGHLLAGHVWPTLEVMISESPDELRKTYHPELNMALIDIGQSVSS
jgi:uncharacterized protein